MFLGIYNMFPSVTANFKADSSVAGVFKTVRSDFVCNDMVMVRS